MKVNPLYDNVYKRFGQILLDKWICDEDKYELQNNPKKLEDMSRTLFKYYHYNGHNVFLWYKMIENSDMKAFKIFLKLKIRNQRFKLYNTIDYAILSFKADFVQYLFTEYGLLESEVKDKIGWYLSYICGNCIHIKYEIERPSNLTIDDQIKLLKVLNDNINGISEWFVPTEVFYNPNPILFKLFLKNGHSFLVNEAFTILIYSTTTPQKLYDYSKKYITPVLFHDITLEQIVKNGYECLSIIFEWFEELKENNFELFTIYIKDTIYHLQNRIMNPWVSFGEIWISETNFLTYETGFWRENIPKLIHWAKEMEIDCNILETYINVYRKAPVNIIRNRVVECCKEISILNQDVVKHVLCSFF